MHEPPLYTLCELGTGPLLIDEEWDLIQWSLIDTFDLLFDKPVDDY
jgi:hypothetical protein